MTSYITITDAETDPEAPLTSELAKKWRDNPIAIAEGSNGSPINQTGWHPYNKVTVGDSNTGLIYNFPTDGAVATVTSPDFVDGYDYAFFIDRILGTSAILQDLRIDWYRGTSAAYSGPSALPAMLISTTTAENAFIELPMVRVTKRYHDLIGSNRNGTTDTLVGGFTFAEVSSAPGIALNTGITHATPQKILRVRFSAASGNITGSGADGKIYMYRRRVFY